MVETLCEKTGLTFDARSKRQRNHPTIMALLSEASRYGWYSDALKAIEAGRKAGYTTIEEFVSEIHAAEAEYKRQRGEEISAELERQRQQAEARRQRYVIRSLLSNHGYCFVDLGFALDEEIDNAYTGPAPRHDYHLKSPDGRFVSLKQAMQELAAQNVKFAVEWCQEHGIAPISATQEDSQSTEETSEQLLLRRTEDTANAWAAYQWAIDQPDQLMDNTVLQADAEKMSDEWINTDLYQSIALRIKKKPIDVNNVRRRFVQVYVEQYRKER